MARKRSQTRRPQVAEVLDDQAVDELEELAADLDEVEDDETDEETDEAKTMRPGDLADELEMSPKVLRAWLRKTYPRKSDEKNTSWHLSTDQVEAARNHFSEEDEEETDELDEVEEVEVA